MRPVGQRLTPRGIHTHAGYGSKGASMRIGRKRVLSVGTAVGLALVMATAGGAAMASDDGQTPDGHGDDHHDRAAARHVLLISVDGLHQSDLAWYVGTPPALGAGPPGRHGVAYTRARPPPVGLLPRHGRPGHRRRPRHHRHLLRRHLQRGAAARRNHRPQGAKPGCRGGPHFEDLAKDKTLLDSGQGLTGLPGQHPLADRRPAKLIDPAKLPVHPRTLQAGLPALLPQGEHHLRGGPPGTDCAPPGPTSTRPTRSSTAPAGTGVQDLFTPEINSDALGYAAGRRLDQGQQGHPAVRQLQGGGRPQRDRRLRPLPQPQVGTPAIFGLNFQSVSTAQKLPKSVTATWPGLPGGYNRLKETSRDRCSAAPWTTSTPRSAR